MHENALDCKSDDCDLRMESASLSSTRAELTVLISFFALIDCLLTSILNATHTLLHLSLHLESIRHFF